MEGGKDWKDGEQKNRRMEKAERTATRRMEGGKDWKDGEQKNRGMGKTGRTATRRMEGGSVAEWR